MATFTPLKIKKGMTVQHTTGSGLDIVVGLYEAVVDQDQVAPEAVVAPVTPVWDDLAGAYKVGDGTKWKDAVAAYITDSELIRASETTISWPDAQSKLNYCICRFQNESKDFKEDIVMWPDKSGPVYATYLEEDGDVELETDMSLTGITSYYTALAKAEYAVRSSRSKITYTFSVNRDFLYLEPGDIVKFQSDVMRVPGEIDQSLSDKQRALFGDLILILEVKPDNQGSIKITAERYDANVLAWNVKDDEVSPIRQIFNRDLAQATNLSLVSGEGFNVTSAGVIKWTNSIDARVTQYRIKIAPVGIPSLATEWTDLGVSTSGVKGFTLPMLKVDNYLFTVVAASPAKQAPQKSWPILSVTTGAMTSVEILLDPIAFIGRRNSDGEYLSDFVTASAITSGFMDPRFEWNMDGLRLATRSYSHFRDGKYYHIDNPNTVLNIPSEGYIPAEVVYYTMYNQGLFKNAAGEPLSPQPSFVEGPVIKLPPFAPGVKECSVMATEYLFEVQNKAYETDKTSIYSFNEGSEGALLLFSNSVVNLTATAVGDTIHVIPVTQLDKKISTNVFIKGVLYKNEYTTDENDVSTLLPYDNRPNSPYITYEIPNEGVDGCTLTINAVDGRIKILSLIEPNASAVVKATVYLDGVTPLGVPIATPGRVISVTNILSINAQLPGNADRLAKLAIDNDMFIVKTGEVYSDLAPLELRDISSGYVNPKRVWSVTYIGTVPLDDTSRTLQDTAISNANLSNGAASLSIIPFPVDDGYRIFKLTVSEADVVPPVGSTEEEIKALTYASSDTITCYSIREGSSNLLLTLSDANRVIPSDWLGGVKAPFNIFDVTARVRRGAEELTDDLDIVYSLTQTPEGMSSVASTIDATTGIASLAIDEESTTVIGGTTFYALVPKAVAGTTDDVLLSASFRYTKTMSSPPPEGAFTVDIGTQGNVMAFIKWAATGLWSTESIVATTVTNRADPDGTLIDYLWTASVAGSISGSTTGKNCTIIRNDTTADWTGANTITVKASYTENGILSEVYDSMNVFALEEGSSAYAIALTNPNQMVRCDSTGAAIGTLSLSTNAVAVRGINLLIAGTAPGSNVDVVFSKSSEVGCTGTVSALGAMNISAITADEGYLEVTGTIYPRTAPYTPSIGTVTARLNFYKSYAGVGGLLVGIAQRGLVFKKNKDNVISPTSLQLSLNTPNLTEVTQTWSGGITTPTRTVYATDYASVTTNTYSVTINGKQGGVAIPSITDSITIPLIIDGDPSVTVNLGNDNVTFQAGPSGSPLSYAGSTCTVEVYRGGLALSYSSTGGANTFNTLISGNGISPSASSGTSFTVSGMGDGVNSATVDVTVTARDGVNMPLPNVKKTATYSVSRTARASIKGVAFARSMTDLTTPPTGGNFASPTPTAPAGWSDGIPAGTDPLWMSSRLFTIDGAAPQDAYWSAPKKVSSLGKDVKVEFSIDGSTNWHTPGVEADKWMRTCTSSDGGATWSCQGAIKIKGETGAAAITINLTNDNQTISTNTAGDWPGGVSASTIVEIFEGGAAATGWTFNWSAPGMTPSTVNNSATYTCTGMSGDNGVATVTASKPLYSNQTAAFTVSKAKTGTPGTQYWITASANSVKKVGSTCTPSTVSFYAKRQVGTNAPEDFSVDWKWANLATPGSLSAWGTGTSVTTGPIVNHNGGVVAVAYYPGTSVVIDSESVPIIEDGTPGTTGANGTASYTATLYLQHSDFPNPASPPGAPVGGSYNFNSGLLSPPGGQYWQWGVTQPNVSTLPTFAADFTFTTTAPITALSVATAGTWTGVRVDAIKSADGYNMIVVEAYKSVAAGASVSDNPGLGATFTFDTGTASAFANSWQASMPQIVGNNTIWMCSSVFRSRTNTATAQGWSNPVIVGNYIDNSLKPGRQFDGYLYLVAPRIDPPGTPPTILGVDFTTGVLNWSSTDPWSQSYSLNLANTSANTATNSYWAIRVHINEPYYNGTPLNIQTSGIFRHINNDGLVTFTNLANALNKDGQSATIIDGGCITTGSIVVDRLAAGSASQVSNIWFGLGVPITIGNTSYDAAVSGSCARYDAVGGGFYSNGPALGAIGSTAAVFNNIAQTKACGISTPNYSIDAQSVAYIPQGVTPFTGVHETCVLKTESIEIGDLLVDSRCLYRKDVSNTTFESTVSSVTNQKNIIGVYSGLVSKLPSNLYYKHDNEFHSEPIIISCFANLLETHNGVFVNSIGEGQVNVCGENGDIAAGDLIVTSSIPGKGMKQADDIVRSYTVARTREAVTFQSPTEVKMVACIYMCG